MPTGFMLSLIVQNYPHRAFTHFGGKLVRCLAHDAPSYSEVGASAKPGAVQPFRFDCPLFADELEGGEAFEGLQPLPEVVGADEVNEAISQLADRRSGSV